MAVIARSDSLKGFLEITILCLRTGFLKDVLICPQNTECLLWARYSLDQ